jgi:hypothetical protein
MCCVLLAGYLAAFSRETNDARRVSKRRRRRRMKRLRAAAWFAGAYAFAFCMRAGPLAEPAPSPSASSSPSSLEQQIGDVDPTAPVRAWNLQAFYTSASYGPGDLRVLQIVPREEVLVS